MSNRQVSSVPLSGFAAPTYPNRVPVDLSIYTGDTFTQTFAWVEDGEPVSLSGWTGAAMIKSAVGGTTIATFAVEVVNSAGGVFRLRLTAAETAALDAGTSGVWDVQFTHTDERVKTPVVGTVTIEGDITDA